MNNIIQGEAYGANYRIMRSSSSMNESVYEAYGVLMESGLVGQYFAAEAAFKVPIYLPKAVNLKFFLRSPQKSTDDFFSGARYTKKVVNQMKKTSDPFNSFPRSIDAEEAKNGVVSVVTGREGKTYYWLTWRTFYKGRFGTFEYIKDLNGEINHRYFKVD